MPQNTLRPKPEFIPEDALTKAMLRSVLDAKLPEQNKDGKREKYDELLEELVAFGITSPAALLSFLDANWDAMMAREEESRNDYSVANRPEGHPRGNCYFTHIGLVRVAMGIQFRKAYVDYMAKVTASRKEERRKKRLEAKNP